MTVFEKPIYRTAFEKFRRMPNEIFEKYFSCLQPPKLTSGQAFDVGAGTGMQTEMLLSRLPMWKVIALEPSVELAGSALTRLEKYSRRVSFLQCSFEELSVQNEYNVIWMSEVVHLLGNVSSWIVRLANIMRQEGRVLIRTSTHSQLRNRQWYCYDLPPKN